MDKEPEVFQSEENRKMSVSKSARPSQRMSVKTLESIINRGHLSFLPVSKRLSLKQFSKAYKPTCCVVSQSHFSSLLGNVNITEKQILEVQEVKQAAVVYGCGIDGQDFTIPASSTDVLFAPIPPEGISAVCGAGELLTSKFLPAVIVPKEPFADANGKSVDGGTHLFPQAKPKSTLFRSTRKTLKAASSNGEVVIDAYCPAHFSTRLIALTLQEIVDHFSLPMNVKPISDDEDLNGVPQLLLNEVAMEDVIVASAKFDGHTEVPVMELPTSFNIDVVVVRKMATQDVVKMIEGAGIKQAAAANMKRQLEDLVPPPLPEKGDALLRSLAPKPPPTRRRDSASSSDSNPDVEYEVVYDELSEPGGQHHPRPRLSTPPTMQGHGSELMHSPSLPNRPLSRLLPPKPPSLTTIQPVAISAHTQNTPYQPKAGEYMHLQRPSFPMDSDSYATVTGDMVARMKTYPTPQSWAPTPPPSHAQERRSECMTSVGTSAALPTPDVFTPKAVSSFSYDTMSLSSSSQYSDPSDENIEYLKSLSCTRVLHLLESMRLECYREAFQHEQIDGEVLSSLDDEMLLELGVKSSLHRMRLKKVIRGVLSAKEHLDANTLTM